MKDKQKSRGMYLVREIYLAVLIAMMAFFTNATCLFGQNIRLSSVDTLVSISSQVHYILEGESYTFDTISSEGARDLWKKYDEEYFTSRASDQILWFKITAQNLTKEDIWLEVGGSIACWEIDFYAPDSLGNYGNPILTGGLRPVENKAYPSNFYWLPLAKAGDTRVKTYYIRLMSELAKEHPLYIGNIKSLSQKEDSNNFLSLIFVGIVLGMFIYNLFLWYATKDHIYFRYICYLGMAGLQCTFLNNFPLSDSIILYDYYLIWNNLLVFSIIFFVLGYLRVRQLLPLIYKGVWIFAVITLLGLMTLNVLGVKLSQVIIVYNLFVIILAAVIIGTGIYLWFKGYRHARIFVIGWLFAIMGFLVTILTINGILPRSLFTRNGMYFGFGIEVLLFSLALADRLNRTEEEKQEMKEENFKLITNQNKILEEKIEQRTQEVEAQKQEIVIQNEELRQQQEEVIAQRDFIERQNEQLHHHNLRITDSIRYAQTIQEAALPSREKMLQKLKEYFIIYRPKDIVSGDFYWVIEAHNSIYVVVGDCTGHGVPGAFMSIIGLSLLNEIVLGNEAVSPKEILTALNQKITIALRQEQTANRDGMDIALCRLISEGENIKVTFSGAKTSIYYMSPEDSSVQQVKGDRKSLGGDIRPNSVRAKETVFTDHELLLPTNTMLYMTTDGFADQGNSQGRKIGSVALKKQLAKCANQTLQEQKNSIIQLLENHQKDLDQRDDITVLGMKL